jgi:putative DNA primase/helicase
VFDNIPVNLIPVENGVLKVDFETGNVELLPLSPQYFFTSKLPVKYDPEAKCPKIEKFLSEIVEPENKQLLIEAIAYTLYRDNPWRKMFLLVGEGANGKTTFLTLLERFLGIRNISSRSMFELVEERFAKADLYRKWANICDELPYGRLLTTEVIKRLTGQSLVTAENKFKNSFQFKFWGKMIFAGNVLPKVFEESSAFYDRLILIIFPYRFVEKPMAENEKPVNKNLINEITTEEELSGLLNLALQNLPKVLKEGFSYAKRVDEVRELYTKVSDPVAAFVMEKIETDPESWIPKDELYTAFVLYCKQNKLPILANNVFFKRVESAHTCRGS